MTTSYISRTGRVQSWLDDPTSRLPVSCTVFTVEDSIEGDNSVEDERPVLSPDSSGSRV